MEGRELHEDIPQTPQSADISIARRRVADFENFGDLFVSEQLEVTQGEDFPIGIVDRLEGLAQLLDFLFPHHRLAG